MDRNGFNALLRTRLPAQFAPDTACASGNGGGSISSPDSSSGSTPQPGLFLLFDGGKRPDAARVIEALAALDRVTVSHLPECERDGGHPGWLELLIDGMTFDLSGLAPAEPAEMPEMSFRFDWPEALEDDRLSATLLAPGPHIAGDFPSLPVVRAQAALGALLTEALPEIAAIGWGPSRSLIGAAFFRSTVGSWLCGGPFPALGLTSFRPTIDDGLQSLGLAQLTGQELRLEPALVGDRAAATQLAVRLVNLLVGAGRLDKPDRIIGPEGGTLLLEPSANGRFVRVYPG